MAFPKSAKSTRTWSLESMRHALQAVDRGMSIRNSAEMFGIPRNTLTSYVASGNGSFQSLSMHTAF